MHPTPLHSHVGQGAFSDVYDPAEDTFLLIDVLERDKDKLNQCSICLEVGCGSGVVSVFLASAVGPRAFYLCTDINPLAAACTLETSRCNKTDVQPLVTDLVEGLLPRLCGKVDILVFNPPYVVTPSEEVGGHGIEAAWAGGKKGREVIDRFLPYVSALLSNGGLFYLVTVQENNPDEIIEILKRWGLPGTVAMSRKAGRETLSVLRFSKVITVGCH
ncbi:methyltransferase N6AMT1 [Latimeria chalumnae]|uniref:Methyltransferase HEMK2 n=1 Tax=Latimeria chalumnae TaxID=7897 RepID=H3AAY7_LATCH|nr:PREDICTED: hemK methyltransferase family member 2 [Latimeria chalumnae]XP_014346758.1 PREDICTED: hemK methyltransferase family member 2 [Latimeria chalumnae]|eukprot:XP_006000806.1 PREDICTED: hemK methyltransferase family member 2 [Latimeria chalumnae]